MSRVQNISSVLIISTSVIALFFLPSVSSANAEMTAEQVKALGIEHEGEKTDSEWEYADDLKDKSFIEERTMTEEEKEAMKDRLEYKKDMMKDLMQREDNAMTDRTVEKTDAMRMQMDQKREALHSRIETIKHNLADRIDTQRARMQEKASQLSDRIEAKRMEMEERKAERQAKIAKHHQDRILEHVKRLIRRLSAAIERMEIMAGRIQSRIDKLVERGLDMADEQALLSTALSHIASAQTDIDALEGAVIAMLDSEDPREAYVKVKELVRTTIASVKGAHKALVDAIRSVKANQKANDLDKDDDTDESADTAS